MKINEAKHYDKTGLVMVADGKVYHKSYGDNLNVPSCTCYSWLDSAYPCKHFFAAMQKYPDWSWLQLSGLYRNSPFLKLDLREDELSFYNPPASSNESDQKLDKEVLAEQDRITEEPRIFQIFR